MQSLLQKSCNAEDIFEAFVLNISNIPVNTINKVKNYKIAVGSIWEEFCCEYLNHIGFRAVRLQDVSEYDLTRLSLKSRDVGIDLIATDVSGNDIAVQCKYRKNCQKLSWKDVSTFDALCMRTGPWYKRIVMTTSCKLHREGNIQDEDVFWGKRHFKQLQRHDWLKIVGYGEGNICGTNSDPVLSKNDLRNARIHFYSKK